LSSGNGYQGLDRSNMEPVHAPAPHRYVGLDIQAPGAGLDRHGYIEVIPDPEYDGHPQVCTEIH